MAANAGQGEYSNIDLAALRLKPGTWLQLQSSQGALQNYAVEFVAAVQGKTVFVAMADAAADAVNNEMRIRVGDNFLVRGFNGVSDFAFNAQVQEVQIKPFVNVQLSYPEFVQSRLVREALRVRTALPATAQGPGMPVPLAAQVRDLSVAGALIESAASLGSIGADVQICLPARFEAHAMELHLAARIRHVNRSSTGAAFRSGVEFLEIGREDKLMLYYLLFSREGEGR